jgi:hypothetical protein
MVLKPYSVLLNMAFRFLKGKMMVNRQKMFTMTLLASAIGAIFISSPVYAENGLVEALTEGKVSFSARARYESVEQDNGLKDADAFTLRTTLGYKTGQFNGFSAFVEFEDVSDLGIDDYNSTTNGKSSYSIIADPEGTEVNQAYIGYQFGANEIKFGRQEIFYRQTPFHRFIGNVVWRQNHQGFDGLRFTSKALADTTLEYAYINQINTIFGDDRNTENGLIVDGDIDVSGHLFNAQYSGLSIGAVSAYVHLMDYKDLEAISNQTVGVRLNGAQGVSEDLKIIYTAEYAQQDDYKGGTQEDHNYYLAELGGKYKGWLGKVSHEVQEGDGTTSFKTRLGTNHAYQGWSDQFLSTPAQGLEDTYFTVVGKVLGAKLVMVYHDYETDDGGIDAGDEFNILLAKKFAKDYTVAVKYADYNAGDLTGKVDTEKLWVWGEVKF